MNGVAGPNIVFAGADAHVVSGSGATDDHDSLTGLGRLAVVLCRAAPIGGCYAHGVAQPHVWRLQLALPAFTQAGFPSPLISAAP
jgi:hypothetical protein